ncbi:hypothetical protein L9F63_003759, partial [Diploptera punctata]
NGYFHIMTLGNCYRICSNWSLYSIRSFINDESCICMYIRVYQKNLSRGRESKRLRRTSRRAEISCRLFKK